jgi:hypothetical protein
MLLLAFASYFISDCLWSAFFKSKRHKPSHHVKVAVHWEGNCSKVRANGNNLGNRKLRIESKSTTPNQQHFLLFDELSIN